jgi:hypothetical protein
MSVSSSGSKSIRGGQEFEEEAGGEFSLGLGHPPASIPSPCMLGSPFTTLAVTHNYHSLLHAEPFEHPFNFIVWLDVVGSRSKMEVSIGRCWWRVFHKT